MIQLTLINGARVEVSPEELRGFITQKVLTPNPDWRHSGLLAEEVVMRFLKGESTQDDLKSVARYILIYAENISYTAYLFDKSEGNPDQGKAFNMPAVEKLREIYRRVTGNHRTTEELAGDVHEMENICLEIGADPL